MKLLSVLLVPLVAAVPALAAVRTSAPAGCITVGTAKGAAFGTIQAAVDSLSTTSTDAQCIFIQPGEYAEKVHVVARAAQLTFYGYTENTAAYASNQVTITNNTSQNDGYSNDESATLRVKATNFKMYNINVANTYGKGSQAVALSAYATSAYYACQFTGYQDTLLAHQGTQLYAKSLIEGATDFIFGKESPAWFDRCDIRVVSASLGYITANGRESDNGASFYVFNTCNISAADGATVPVGAYFLARPWGEYARVVYQYSTMSSVINSAGWTIWNKGDERTAHVLFGEYQNGGDGATGSRASFSTQLTVPVDITAILGSGYASAKYYDATYMP